MFVKKVNPTLTQAAKRDMKPNMNFAIVTETQKQSEVIHASNDQKSLSPSTVHKKNQESIGSHLEKLTHESSVERDKNGGRIGMTSQRDG